MEPDRLYANWMIFLLPFVDQQSVYNQFNLMAPIVNDDNKVPRLAELSILKCPSDPYNESSNHYERGMQSGNLGFTYARGNYAMNMGSNKGCIRIHGAIIGPGTTDSLCFVADGTSLLTDTRILKDAGIGGVNVSYELADMTAGTSHIVGLEEIRAGVHPLDPRGTWALGFSGASGTVRHGDFDENEDAYGPNNQSASSDDIQSCTALKAALGGSFANRRMPCFASPDPLSELNAQATSRSMHPGGVQVLTLDGSVHFIQDNISIDVWRMIHNRNHESEYPFEF